MGLRGLILPDPPRIGLSLWSIIGLLVLNPGGPIGLWDRKPGGLDARCPIGLGGLPDGAEELPKKYVKMIINVS